MKQGKKHFRYKAHMSVGAMSAEADERFINSCFIETSDFDVLKDFTSAKCILLGRTGTGKSAAIININNTQDQVISIDPQTLAINYIANSDILRFLSNMGVKLDLFYRLLWQHVFCVELLNHHFKMKNEREFARFKDWISGLGKKDKSAQIAAEYLEKWNAKFWLEREERIKEITKTLENSIVAEAGIEASGLRSKLEGKHDLTEETKMEIVHKAQKVVNEIQIQNLSQVIDVIARELYNDDQKKTFITIDSLDEDWVEDELRYKLIRALIETIKKFRRIKSLKILVALRSDLLGRVYNFTRDSGFQEEKYEDFNLRVSWTSDQLKAVLDARINQLFKNQYTDGNVEFYDIFPEKVRQDIQTLDFIITRSLMRPRDVIAFVNNILEQANGHETISAKMILDSERGYSEKRLDAVMQEWVVEYPKLKKCLFVLRNKPTSFSASLITKSELEELLMVLNYDKIPTADLLETSAREQLEVKLDIDEFRRTVLQTFFRVGLIGCKEYATHPIHYCYSINANEPNFNQETKIQIHPMFWAALGNRKLRGGVLEPANE